jgi:oxygen-independent coproporphyrinogen-3 oxidase
MLDLEKLLETEASQLPRYTSYPPANHFNSADLIRLNTKLDEAVQCADSLSVYLHIPFCDRLCWFCGCHTKHTLSYKPVASYVDVLVKDIVRYAGRKAKPSHITKLHLGGGSPSLLKKPELDKIREALDMAFNLDANTEISVELDPSDLRPDSIQNLIEFGLTRASIGVQDFDPEIQVAINRPQSYEITRDVVEQLRKAGVKSVNIDALYGLPGQTTEKLQNTVTKVLSLAPDRISLFGYAHVPWVKPHQKMIDETTLPGQRQRLHDAQLAASMIVDAGYESIGIDHFAKPDDSLARASRDGKLHRNFQGYTDDDAEVLLGFGPSSISSFPDGFAQNQVATGNYTAAVTSGQSTVARGLVLSEVDKLNGWIIERLICDFAVSRVELECRFADAGREAWAKATTLATTVHPDLCQISAERFEMLPEARPLVRLIASKFDTWLQASAFQYSKAV